MGGFEVSALAGMEPTVKYHPYSFEILTSSCESRKGTVAGGQFDWGGCLLKSNGGAQKSPQAGWQSAVECKGIWWLDCERDISSRGESRA